MEWPDYGFDWPLPQVLHLCKKYVRGPVNQGKMNQFSFCLVSAIWSPSPHTFFFSFLLFSFTPDCKRCQLALKVISFMWNVFDDKIWNCHKEFCSRVVIMTCCSKLVLRVRINLKRLNGISLLEPPEARSNSSIPDSVIIEKSLCD